MGTQQKNEFKYEFMRLNSFFVNSYVCIYYFNFHIFRNTISIGLLILNSNKHIWHV